MKMRPPPPIATCDSHDADSHYDLGYGEFCSMVRAYSSDHRCFGTGSINLTVGCGCPDRIIVRHASFEIEGVYSCNFSSCSLQFRFVLLLDFL